MASDARDEERDRCRFRRFSLGCYFVRLEKEKAEETKRATYASSVESTSGILLKQFEIVLVESAQVQLFVVSCTKPALRTSTGIEDRRRRTVLPTLLVFPAPFSSLGNLVIHNETWEVENLRP
jgi:hypothetical protein